MSSGHAHGWALKNSCILLAGKSLYSSFQDGSLRANAADGLNVDGPNVDYRRVPDLVVRNVSLQWML